MTRMRDAEVVIAVLTFRRHTELATLLRELVEHIESSETDASILVVDNDEVPSARDIVLGMKRARYVHEPRPGIAAARNRALAEVDPNQLLVFIDDDERPQPGWLDALVGCWQATRPAAVAGPVVSVFDATPDPWIVAGGFFVRPTRRTGTEMRAAATNNLLLDVAAIRRLNLRFDEGFGLSGGSDTLFTRSLVLGGGRIVWCNEAVVLDVVPAERLTRRWVLRRAARMANSGARAQLVTAAPGFERCWVNARLLVAGTARLVIGVGQMALGALSARQRHRARGARLIARGRGMLLAVGGLVVAEYERSTSPASDSRVLAASIADRTTC